MGTRIGLVLRYIVLSGGSLIHHALRIVMDGSSIDPSRRCIVNLRGRFSPDFIYRSCGRVRCEMVRAR